MPADDQLIPAQDQRSGFQYLQDDASLLAPVHDVWPGQPWMEFNLIHAQDSAFALAFLGVNLLDVRLQFVEMVHSEVADSNASNLACLHSFGQRFPGT